jgi:hypothetical protein
VQFLDIAQNMLVRGLRMLEADLIEDAGRAAYLAPFHAAQALNLRTKRPADLSMQSRISSGRQRRRISPSDDARLSTVLVQRRDEVAKSLVSGRSLDPPLNVRFEQIVW